MNCCERHNIDCRQGRDCPERHPILLSSRAFWIGGLLSLALWTGLWWAVT